MSINETAMTYRSLLPEEHLMPSHKRTVRRSDIVVVREDGSSCIQPGAIIDQRFKIIRELGCGGMGTVYLANHLQMNKEVALKVMHAKFVDDPGLASRFQREARALAAVSHPNIVNISSFGMIDDLPYMVMEFVRGGSLADLLVTKRRFAVSEALPVFRQICAGVTALHAAGILHRDLKPDNVMLIPGPNEWQAKLVDFGLAQICQDGKEIQRLTATGQVVGDPRYMSPEQCRGQQLDQRSDVYSMGCLMYETLTGSPPFVSGNAMLTMFKRLNEPVPPFPPGLDIPSCYEEIVMDAMALDRDQRFWSIAELSRQLEDAAAGKYQRMPRRRRTRLFKNTLMLSAISVLLLLVAVCATIFFGSPGAPPANHRQPMMLPEQDLTQDDPALDHFMQEHAPFKSTETVSEFDRLAHMSDEEILEEETGDKFWIDNIRDAKESLERGDIDRVISGLSVVSSDTAVPEYVRRGALQSLVYAYTAKSEYELAREACVQSSEASEPGRDHCDLAMCELRLNNLQQASSAIDAAEKSGNVHPNQILFLRCLVLAKQGNTSEAAQLMQKGRKEFLIETFGKPQFGRSFLSWYGRAEAMELVSSLCARQNDFESAEMLIAAARRDRGVHSRNQVLSDIGLPLDQHARYVLSIERNRAAGDARAEKKAIENLYTALAAHPHRDYATVSLLEFQEMDARYDALCRKLGVPATDDSGESKLKQLIKKNKLGETSYCLIY